MNTTPAALGISNTRSFSDSIWTAGQPSPDQIAQLPAAGIQTVINLCAEGECGWDERSQVQALGLTYHAIAIGGAHDLNRDAALRLDQLLETCAHPVLVHCASSNRVGALFALRSAWVQAADVDTALEHGRAAGLKAMEPMVRQILAQG